MFTIRRNGLRLCGLFAVAGAIMAHGPAAAAELGAKDEPIKIAMLEWTGQHVTAQIAGRLLEKAGYKVEYITAGNFPQFSGLADGTISMSPEIWLNNVGDIFPTALAEKKIENVGLLGLETREGWIYPSFVADLCPGLPDWKALEQPDCVAALATPDTLPNGRFLDYPADWGSRSATIIADNNLPLTAVPAGSEGAMVAELRAAEAAKTPLLMMFWAPHYALAEADVQWIDMPPCTEETNTHCITPPDVAKVLWSGYGAKWPAAYELMKAFTLTTEDQQVMMQSIDEKGQSLGDVADAWIADHEAIWKPWVDAAIQ